ncbi:hypothetical protein PIB30_001780 [Stylosanthes scabra]|uniref:Uncharacterized protein n=1 Tax=Stylosanthes scabra TaxID=79078 RepID=A0ABU6V5Z6_9FABA|nr:hypothetical protein [Stylosanthes scabra]
MSRSTGRRHDLLDNEILDDLCPLESRLDAPLEISEPQGSKTYYLVVWKPYLTEPSGRYAAQRAVGRSITYVICCNYALAHRLHVAHRQLLDGESFFQLEWLDTHPPHDNNDNPRPKLTMKDDVLQRLIESWDSKRTRLISESKS